MYCVRYIWWIVDNAWPYLKPSAGLLWTNLFLLFVSQELFLLALLLVSMGLLNSYLWYQLPRCLISRYYYTLLSLSVFLLAKSLQLILEISATYRLVSYLLADNWLICRLRAQCMISNNNINSGSLRRCVCPYFLQSNVTIIRFGFCDILNNQGLGKCYQPRPSAWLITFISALIIPDITKTLSNIFFLVYTH